MKNSNERFLTTHVGSLVRPPKIRNALIAQQLGTPYDEDEFAINLRHGVADVVRKQADIGIDIPSDGEYSKPHWVSYIADRLNGVEVLDWNEAIAKGATGLGWMSKIKDRVDFADFYAAYMPVERYDWTGTAEDTLVARAQKKAKAILWHFNGPISYAGPEIIRRDIDNFKSALGKVKVAEAFMPVASPMAIEAGQSNPFYAKAEEFIYAIADALKS